MRDPRVTAVILAGGAGRRVGGRDKGWLIWQDRGLVEHVFAGIAPQVGTVLISANRNLDRYRGLGAAVLPDRTPGHAGPLAGIVRAFDEIATEWLVTVPVDVPTFPADLVQRLIGAALAARADGAVAHDGERAQTLFAIYAAGVHERSRHAFDAGVRAVWEFQADSVLVSAHFDPHEFDAPDLTTLAS